MIWQLCILVAGALGGRFDHESGNLNVLYNFPTTRIILLSDDCLIHLLPKTHSHEIYIQSSIEGPHCGLIPIGMPSRKTTTTGLQWDLSKYMLTFILQLLFLVQGITKMIPLLACLMIHSPVMLFTCIILWFDFHSTETKINGVSGCK